MSSFQTYGDVHANEYSSMDVLNMVGKAGAAEMDEPKGVAIILTSTEKIVSTIYPLYFCLVKIFIWGTKEDTINI